MLRRASATLVAPRTTFALVAAERRWAGLLILLTAVVILSNAILLRTDVGQLALLDRLERMAQAFGQEVDDTRYAELTAWSEHGAAYAGVTGLLEGPILTFAITGLIYTAFTVFARGTASLSQILAVVTHASVILALRELIGAPISYAYETLGSPTTLARLIPVFDETSGMGRFLGSVDLFVVWWVIWLALGTSTLYRRPVRQTVGTFVGGYVALALLLALVMALAGGTA
jgi:hypothetical protein